MRQCIDIEIEGLRLSGTFHRPAAGPAGAPTATAGAGQPGVLFFNSGFLPRSAQGDLLAHVADDIAAIGFPVFRFDLPGLGDSDGKLPEDAVTFVRAIEQGDFAPYAALLSGELASRFGLKKIIVGGLCGGGITALFSVAQARDKSRVGGIIMLDPIFHLVQVQELLQSKISRRARWRKSLAMRVNAVYEELRIWILSRRLGAPLQKIHARWKAAKIQSRKAAVQPASPDLPKEANRKLIQSFEHLRTAGLPMLVITAQDPRRTGKPFDYLEYILRTGQGAVTCHKIEGTNHSFLAGAGPQAVQELVGTWLDDNFTPSQPCRAAVMPETPLGQVAVASFPLDKPAPATPSST